MTDQLDMSLPVARVNTRDNIRLAVSASIASGISHLGSTMMPFQTNSLIEGFHISASAAGMFGFLEISSLSVAMLMVLPFLGFPIHGRLAFGGGVGRYHGPDHDLYGAVFGAFPVELLHIEWMWLWRHIFSIHCTSIGHQESGSHLFYKLWRRRGGDCNNCNDSRVDDYMVWSARPVHEHYPGYSRSHAVSDFPWA